MSDGVEPNGDHVTDGDALRVDGSLEVLRAASLSAGWSPSAIQIHSSSCFRPIPEGFESVRADWIARHSGEASYSKVSLSRVVPHQGSSTFLTVTVDSTEWKEVQPLHEQLMSPAASDLADRWVGDFQRDGSWTIPNILTIHGVLLTADERLVVAQRSRHARYHALHWSLSYEEQVEFEDLGHGGSAFHRAASRGICEEFLGDGALDPSATKLVALTVERRIANPAFIAITRVGLRSHEVAELHRAAIDNNEFEPNTVEFIPATPEALSRLLELPSYAPNGVTRGKWHPTARYRLRMTILHLFGEQALDATPFGTAERRRRVP